MKISISIFEKVLAGALVFLPTTSFSQMTSMSGAGWCDQPLYDSNGGYLVRSFSTSRFKLRAQGDSSWSIDTQPLFLLKRGESAVLDGTASRDVTRYQWEISGLDLAGKFRTVVISGDGIPGVIELNANPQTQGFDFGQMQINLPEIYQVALKTCSYTYLPQGPGELGSGKAAGGSEPEDHSISFLSFKYEPSFWIPNAFTPNGDGENDYFQGNSALNFLDYQLEVYNRWGQRVFMGLGIDSKWNGQYLFQQCELGTYQYLLHYRMPGEPTRTIKGDLTLIR